jgi:hypothetical protein
MPHVRICAGGAGQPAFLPRPFSPSEQMKELGTDLKKLTKKNLKYLKKEKKKFS